MISLTGGEKYKVKTTVIAINELYPKVQEIVSKEGYENNDSNLNKLYDYSLEVFTMLSKLTINMIESDKELDKAFNNLQKIHYYSSVKPDTKPVLMDFSENLNKVLKALIDMGEGDTTMRDNVLRQIMEELNITDPNAKKKKSFWDN